LTIFFELFLKTLTSTKRPISPAISNTSPTIKDQEAALPSIIMAIAKIIPKTNEALEKKLIVFC